MDIYSESIRDLSPADKLLLVERIWDDLANADSPLPLPDWALLEAARRRDELLQNPDIGVTHGDMWKRIDESRNG